MNRVLIFHARLISVPGVVVKNTLDMPGMDINTVHGHPHTHGRFMPGYPNGIVIHDTVTSSARAGFWALLERKNDARKDMLLGTSLLVDADGTIYQIVDDLAQVTWHASGWSSFKIGIDMACLVDPRLAPNSPLRRPRTTWSEARGYIDYTDAQKASLKALIPIICEAAEITFDCPRDLDGRPATRGYGKGPVRALIGNASVYRGVVAHAQISKVRWDGNRALEVLFGT